MGRGGAPKSPVPLTGDLPGWECPIPVSYMIATNTAGEGSSLTACVDENPALYPTFPDPTPGEKLGHITVAW